MAKDSDNKSEESKLPSFPKISFSKTLPIGLNNKNIKAIKSAEINFQVECEPKIKLSNNYPTQKCKVILAKVTKLDPLKEITWQERKGKFNECFNGAKKLDNFHKKVYFLKDGTKACEEVYETDRVKLDLYIKCDDILDNSKLYYNDNWRAKYSNSHYQDDMHCKVIKADVTLLRIGAGKRN